MHKLLHLLALVAVITSLAMPVSQAETTSALPTNISKFGEVSAIRVSAKEIVIDDTSYTLSPIIRVKTYNGRTASISLVKRGAKVAFSENRKNSSRTITELWLLPSNYRHPE